MSESKPLSIEMDIYGVNNVFLKRETKSFADGVALCEFYNKNKKVKKKKNKKKQGRKN